MMRAVWSEHPVTFKSRYIPSVIEGMTMTPMPVGPIPLWFGGSAEAALKRTIRLGDRWHGSRHTAEQAAPIVKRLREARPDADFTISMRVQWDGTDRGVLRAWSTITQPLGCSTCWWRHRIEMWMIGRK